MIKQSSAVLLLGVISFFSSLALGLSEPEIQDIVQQHLKVHSRLKKVAMDINSVIEIESKKNGKISQVSRIYQSAYYRDNDKVELVGSNKLVRNGKVWLKNSQNFLKYIDGHNAIFIERDLLGSQARSYGELLNDNFLFSILNAAPFGNFLEGGTGALGVGINWGDYLKANPKFLGRETIDGISCYVIQAKGSQGTAKAWIAPARDYNCLKYELHKEGTDLIRKKSINQTNITKWSMIIDKVKFTKIKNIYVASEGVWTRKCEFKNGNFRNVKIKVKRKNFNFDPDFDAIGAFKIALAKKSGMFDKTSKEVRYIEKTVGRLLKEENLSKSMGLPEYKEVLVKLKHGDMSPDFKTKTLDGKEIKLSDFRGKYVLLDFWATWCSPCVGQTETLKKIYAKYSKNKSFVMIGLSFDHDRDKKKLIDYVNKKDLKWLQGWIGQCQWDDNQIRIDYGVEGIPAYFLIDPDGKIIQGRATIEEAMNMLQKHIPTQASAGTKDKSGFGLEQSSNDNESKTCTPSSCE